MVFEAVPPWRERIDLETLALRAGVLITSAVALAFIALRIGLPAWAAPVMLLPAAALAAWIPVEKGEPRPASPYDWLAPVCIGLAAAWVLLLFNHGWALPPGDPIAVPQFAHTLAEGRLLTQAYPPGSSAHAYPPGYPVLLAPVAALAPPLVLLALFKALTLACVVLIPVAWAWLHRRLFAPQAPWWLCLALAYAAFFIGDRTLGFVTPFAGKNALLLALPLFPAVAMATLGLARDPRRWPLAVVPVYGLVLVHYTMLHLTAAVLGAWLLVGLATGRTRWPELVRVVAVGAAAAGLLLLFNHEALSDSRAGSVVFDPLGGLGRLVGMLIGARPAFVAFMDADFGLPASPFRGPVLIGCVALAVAVGLGARRPRLAEAAGVYLLAFLAALAFAVGIVPAGISLDFVRWFAWPLQAGLFLCAGLALAALWQDHPGWPRQALATLAVLAACGGLRLLYADGRVERGVFAQTAVGRADLAAVDAVLPDRDEARPCFLIGDSFVQPGDRVVLQYSRAWSYAETLSPCLFLNGSWVRPGPPGGRAADTLPTAGALRALPPGSAVFFVGSPGKFTAYARRMAREAPGGWLFAGWTAPGEGVWRRAAS